MLVLVLAESIKLLLDLLDVLKEAKELVMGELNVKALSLRVLRGEREQTCVEVGEECRREWRG